MKRHAIFTASDAGCGPFLVDHWLRSLQSNVNLADIDVHVLDYGLTVSQRQSLTAAGVTCHSFPKDGFVSTIRVRDLPLVLRDHAYDQVLMCDAGDLIFQADISHLFEPAKTEFRGVREQIDSSFHHLVMSRSDLPDDRYREITTYLQGKPTINGGFLLGPAARFGELWDQFVELSVNAREYATDQLLLNYKLYREGFQELDPKYNFVVITMRDRFFIREGVFYDAAGSVIPVVHNAGGKEAYRCVSDFGFGKDRNRPRRVTQIFLRVCFAAMNLYRGHWRTGGKAAPAGRKAKAAT